MDWILARLKEPSTWKGLAALLGSIGIAVSPDLILQIGSAAIAVIGIIEMLRKETAK